VFKDAIIMASYGLTNVMADERRASEVIPFAAIGWQFMF
jgi:hypothetical protein